MKKYDNTYLGKGVVYSTNSEETGLNNNELIIGGTSTGKTTSFVEPKLLHAEHDSYIIPVSKRKIVKQYAPYLKKKGYKVYDLNFANPYQADTGFDIFDYLNGEDDYRWFADEITRGVSVEELWNQSARAVLLAEIIFLQLAKEDGVCLQDLILFHHGIRLNAAGTYLTTSIDSQFMEMQRLYPDNTALCGWNLIYENAPKTAMCIFNIVTSCLQIFMSHDLLELCTMVERLDISNIGNVKSVVFVTTSPVDMSTQKYVNLFYTILFKTLYNAAEARVDDQLPIPVHVICDDFACGNKIPDFARYISVLRSTGLSATILLQSESQLNSLYGDNEANIIINNCDTLVYTGGQDTESCKHFSLLTNKPFEDILWLKKGNVIIVRRGSKPIIVERYATYCDPEYEYILKPVK